MHNSAKFLAAFTAAATLALGFPIASRAQQADSQSQTDTQSGMNTHPRRGGRGMGGPGEGLGGARGMLGTVTEVTPEHYTIKTDQGESYTVHYSVNTRIMKQPAGGRRFSPNGTAPGGDRGEGTARGNNPSDYEQQERQIPPSLKPSEIKVGDIITAGGEVDAANKSIGAVFVIQIDAERARQMREMQTNYGKTWLAGRITAIDGTKITIEGMIDHATHAIEVDENTSFRKRRDSITLADIQPGDQLRADGAVKGGIFLATAVNSIATPRQNPPPEPPK